MQPLIHPRMQYHKCHDISLLQSHDENQINILKKVQEKLQFSGNANLKHKREHDYHLICQMHKHYESILHNANKRLWCLNYSKI